LAAYTDQGNKQHVPFYQGLLAEIEAQGDAEGALIGIEEALALAGETGEHLSDAFLHRLHGEILLKRDPANTAPAEDALLTAIAIAQQQKARSFELRAALSLAKLYQSNGRQPMRMPCSLWRSKVFRQPRNFPRSRKRKRFSPRLRDELTIRRSRATSGFGLQRQLLFRLFGVKRTLVMLDTRFSESDP
jgi:hypothetical protein